MINWKNLDTLTSFEELKQVEKVNLAQVMSGESGAQRVRAYSIPMAEGLTYHYAAKQVDDKVIDALAKLADEAQLAEKFEDLYNGAVINTGENRLVLHHLTRGQLGKAVEADGVDKRKFYVEQQERIAEFAEKVHSGKIANGAGEKFTTVVQIGIGGSDLGPRAMYLALENWAKKHDTFKMEAKFISNVDPDDAAAVLNSIDVAHTLFILVSKSGTTLETLTNESFVKDALAKAGLDASKHMIAVTSETSPLAKSDDYLAAFFMDDYIGGRYSSTSAVGGAVLSLAFGPEVFAAFLEGAAAEDRLSAGSDVRKNPAMMDALIGVYERNVTWSPTENRSTVSANRSTTQPDRYSSASPEPTDSTPSISSSIREQISFRCSSSALRTARSAPTLSFRTARASRSSARTLRLRSWLLPVEKRMKTATRILRADVPPASSSANSWIRRLSALCLPILRIRSCSRDSCGMSTALIRRVYSLERCWQRRCWPMRQTAL